MIVVEQLTPIGLLVMMHPVVDALKRKIGQKRRRTDMKKTLIVILVIVLLASISLNVLAGYQRFLIIPQQKWKDSFDDNHLTVVKDKQTGVYYLLYRGYQKAGISVMYDSSGNVLRSKNKNVESFK